MKLIYLFLFFSLNLSSLQGSEPEARRLAHVTADDQTVTFFLDNGWFFQEAVGELTDYQPKSFEEWIGEKVQVTDHQTKPGFRLSIKHARHQFTVALPYETYTMLPTLIEVEIEKLLGFNWCAVFTLSDGSVWETPPLSTIYPAVDYWTLGDHVIITQSIKDPNIYFLVNADIPHAYVYVNGRNSFEEWLSLKDYRTMECNQR